MPNKVISKYVPSLVRLNHLALKKIFDRVTYLEEKELEGGLIIWTKEVIGKVTQESQVYAKQELQIIIKALMDCEQGKYDREKENFKRCEIDYRQAYREGL